MTDTPSTEFVPVEGAVSGEIETPPAGTGATPPPISPEAPERNGSSWLLRGVIGVILLAVVGGGGWMLGRSGTVSESTNDATLADLDAAQSANDATTEELSAVTANLAGEATKSAGIQSDLDAKIVENETLMAENTDINQMLTDAGARTESLESSVTEMIDTVSSARDVAKVDALWDIWTDPTVFEELVALGVPVEPADDLVAMLDLSSATWKELVESAETAFEFESAVRRIDDPAIQEVWRDFTFSEIGSDEEFAASSEFTVRMLETLLERLIAAEDLGEAALNAG